MKNTTTIEVPDQLVLKPKLPTQLLSLSDIHLGEHSTKASRRMEVEICKRLKYLSSQDSAVVVLNGDIFELWAGKDPTVAKALHAHPKWTAALLALSKKPHHDVVLVVGNHDGRLGWDEPQQKVVQNQIGAQICFSLRVEIQSKAIIFEHGHQLDPDNAFEDPRDPHEKPFGQHIVAQALPMVRETQGDLLKGIDHIAEPHKFAKFVASRILYREIFNRLWWLAVPLLILFGLRLLADYGFFAFLGFSNRITVSLIIYTEAVVLITIIVLVTSVAAIVQRLLSRAKPVPGGSTSAGHNTAAWHKAKNLIGQGDTIGLITGHTHRPEIRELPGGFFANSGCGVEMIHATPARLGLPKTYVALGQLSWLELELGEHEGNIVLYQSAVDHHGMTRLERFATRKRNFDKPLHQSHKHTFRY